MKELTVHLSTEHVPDIQFMRQQGKLDIPDARHRLVEINLFNNKETFYLCSGNDDVATIVDFHDLKITEILEEVILNTGI